MTGRGCEEGGILMAMHFGLRDCDDDDAVVEVGMGDRGLETLTDVWGSGGWEGHGKGL